MTGMRASFSVFVSAVSLALAQAAVAAPIQMTYSTTGTVETTGLSGTPVFSFQGVNDAALTTGQPFNLGHFVIDSPPSASGSTYVNTPFFVTVNVQSINGVAPSPNESPVVLEGWLNGTIPLDSTPDIHLTMNVFPFAAEQPPPFPTNIAPFRTGTYMDFLSVVSGDSVYSPIVAELNVVQSVPEPSTVFVFGLIGLALIQYSRRRHIATV